MLRIRISTWVLWAVAFAMIGTAVTALIPLGASAQSLIRARLFRGGSSAGTIAGWPPAPATVDTRSWPPGCGVKQADVTSMFSCPRRYFAAHPQNPLYALSGMNGSNITFDANGWDIQKTATVLGNPGFPVLIQRQNEDYGIASFGPGLGAEVGGTITFAATGADPATLGTQPFTYDPNGLQTPAGPQTFQYPPNSAATTPRPLPNPPNHGGMFRYVTGSERFGGTLHLTGVNNVYLVQTFNPGVATTGSSPVIQGDGAPIPTATVSGATIPGATLINRLKAVEIQRIRINLGFTPGGFVSLGTTVGSRNAFAIREQGPFTTGMITVTQMSRPGVFPTTTVRVDTGSKNTVNGVGTIQLVQPFIIRNMNSSGPNGRSFSTKVVLDVPEPAPLLLLSSGALGLVALFVNRRKGC